MGKGINISLSRFNGNTFHQFLNQCYSFFLLFLKILQYYPTHKHHLTASWIFPLHNIHIKIFIHHSIHTLLYLLYKVKLEKWYYLSFDVLHVLPLFPPSLREIRLEGFGFLEIFWIGYNVLVFELTYQRYKNFCTYIRIFILIFIAFVVLLYFYRNTYSSVKIGAQTVT